MPDPDPSADPPNLSDVSGVYPSDMGTSMATAPDHATDAARPVPVGPANFDEVFREHYGPMVRSLTLACGDREVAADAVQDAFARAYARWPRVARYDDPAAWVRHVALNRIRDHARGMGRLRRLLPRVASRTETVAPPPDLPDETLAAAVAALSPQQRIAVSFFYLEQLSVREIAETMKLSEGAVKYHLHAGRGALRTALEPT